MDKKGHEAEAIVAKLLQVEVLTAQYRPVAEAVRSLTPLGDPVVMLVQDFSRR